MKVCTQNFGKNAQNIQTYKKLGGYSCQIPKNLLYLANEH